MAVLTLRRPIIRFAAFMGTATCYVVTMVALAGCVVVVGILGQASPTATGIIFGLSAFSIVQASTILVEQRQSAEVARHRDEALHAKTDALIRAIDKADDNLISVEKTVSIDLE